MYCNQCGSSLPAGVGYCTHCGKAVGAVPVAPVAARPVNSSVGRVERHRVVLGWLWLIAGLLGVPTSMLMLGLSSTGGWPFQFGDWPGAGIPHFLMPVLGGVGALILVFSVLRIVLAVGLLQSLPWARMLGIVLAIIELIHVPFGTALGIYTLWVMMSDTAEAEYAAMAQARHSGGVRPLG